MKNTMRLHYEDLPVSQKPNALIIEFCTFKWWASNCHVVKCIYLEIIVPSCSVISEKSWFHYGKHYYYLFWWSSVQHKLKRCYIQISATHNCWKCKYGTRSNIHAKIACFAAFSSFNLYLFLHCKLVASFLNQCHWWEHLSKYFGKYHLLIHHPQYQHLWCFT